MMRRQRRTTLLPNRTHCGSVTDAGTDRNRHQEFLALLRKVAAYPRRQLHVVVDNYATHKHPAVRAWLQHHRRARAPPARPPWSGADPGGGVPLLFTPPPPPPGCLPPVARPLPPPLRVLHLRQSSPPP